MFKKIKQILLILALAGLSPNGLVYAKDTIKTPEKSIKAVNIDKEKKLIDAINKRSKTFKINGVSYLPEVNLYEIFIPSIQTPTFTNENITFFLTNTEVVDLVNNVNITKRDRTKKSLEFKEKEDLVLERVKKIVNLKSVTFIPSIKLYEIEIEIPNSQDRAYAYVNEDLTFIFKDGNLFNFETKENLSDRNRGIREPAIQVSKDFSSLPLNSAIKMTYGKTGERAIAIFSDPKCPWCKKMDTDIMLNLKNTNIDIYYFMNPLDITGHEEAPLIAQKVLCAPDKVKAWKEWMLLGKIPENSGEKCKQSLDSHLKIAIERGYNETPTILTDTGFTLKSGLSSSRFNDFLTDSKYFNQPNFYKKVN